MQDPTLLRQEILESLPRYDNPGPRTASTVYVWPTSVCPVGCGHCNFGSPAASADPNHNRIARNVERVLRFVAELASHKVVLSGGGEPMYEPEFVYEFVRRVQTSRVEEIEIITSGMFGSDPGACHAVLQSLALALDHRRERVPLTLRLSVDYFHTTRIGLEPIVNLLRLLGDDRFRHIGSYIRSVLIRDDSTMRDLASALGGELSPLRDFQQTLRLPDGRSVLVYYKNLIVDGRMTWRRLERLGLEPDARASSENFVRRFLNPQGKHVPARVYNGPTVEHLDGLALIVEHDGAVKILEGTAPDRVPSVFDRSWHECLDFFYRDPLTIFLIEEGPQALADLVARYDSSAPQVASRTNQLYYIADKILASPEQRLVATVAVLDHHVRTRRIAADPARLRAWERVLVSRRRSA